MNQTTQVQDMQHDVDSKAKMFEGSSKGHFLARAPWPRPNN